MTQQQQRFLSPAQKQVQITALESTAVARKIIHLDMDAFYVSVELRERPELQGLPVAVGGSAEGRGVIATCNYVARQYGVHSAMSSAMALKRCPDLVMLPGQMQLYRSVSQQVFAIMHRYSDKVEGLSLDEAFIDVSDSPLFHGSATLIAEDLRAAIYRETGLTASAGVASLKFLAKIASDENKPNGQLVIAPHEVSGFINQLPLEKISGVGKVTAKKLHEMGLFTGQDIKACQQSELIHKLGRFGRILWMRCHGIDDRPIESVRIRKSLGVERTFSKDIHNIEQLLTMLHQKLIPELIKRSEGALKDRTICKLGVKLKFNDFVQTTKEIKHASLDADIFESLLREAMPRGEGKSLRLLGVHLGLSDPVKESSKQLELFN